MMRMQRHNGGFYRCPVAEQLFVNKWPSFISAKIDFLMKQLIGFMLMFYITLHVADAFDQSNLQQRKNRFWSGK